MKKLIIILTAVFLSGCYRSTSAEAVDAAKLAFPKCEIYSSRIDNKFVIKFPDGKVSIVERSDLQRTGFVTIENLVKRQ